MKTEIDIPFDISPQPTEDTCGPTCLSAVYKFFGQEVPVERLIEEIPGVEGGGTLAVALGIHALKRGYKARLHTCNLRIFDPTWFHPERVPNFRDKLAAQIRIRQSEKQKQAARLYLEFIDRGGDLRMESITSDLLRKSLKQEKPLLAGLSATFLYRSARENPRTCADDDLRGVPVGHFVILSGYDDAAQEVTVADPLWPNPFAESHFYKVEMEELLNAILLGVLTYDGNLLMLDPPGGEG